MTMMNPKRNRKNPNISEKIVRAGNLKVRKVKRRIRGMMNQTQDTMNLARENKTAKIRGGQDITKMTKYQNVNINQKVKMKLPKEPNMIMILTRRTTD